MHIIEAGVVVGEVSSVSVEADVLVVEAECQY
jgi:hypothetical protein